jgi:flagellar assembly protein FliH
MDVPELEVVSPEAASQSALLDDKGLEATLPSPEDYLLELQALRQKMLDEIEQERQRVLAEAHRIAEQEAAERKRQGYEQGLEEGRAMGRQEGHAQGHAEGYQAGQERMVNEQQRMRELLASLEQPMHLMTEALQEMLSEVVRELAETIVQRELRQDSSHAIKRILQALPGLVPLGQSVLQVFAHPQDIPLMRQALQGKDSALADKGQVELIPDQALDPGGLRVETDSYVLDWSVKNQLEALFEKVLGPS